jgi:hypothetical protein
MRICKMSMIVSVWCPDVSTFCLAGITQDCMILMGYCEKMWLLTLTRIGYLTCRDNQVKEEKKTQMGIA